MRTALLKWINTRWVLVALYPDGQIYVPATAPLRGWLINERTQFAGYDVFPGAEMLIIPGPEFAGIVKLSRHVSFALPGMDPR